VLFLAVACIGWTALAADEPARKTIPILKPVRTEPVDFYREIVPVLQANCLPCHNKTTTKGDLLLETPADMLKGGETGPAIVPGKATESLLLKVASHEEKPRMPPKENKVNAVALSPEELGLLALWIDQGAKASEKRAEVITWQSLPATLTPILAVAVTADGRFAACGRGNQIEVYRVPSGKPLGHLADTNLMSSNAPAAAHRDLVNSLAFSPDGRWLASGGFREVKLWGRSFAIRRIDSPPVVPTNSGRTFSPDGKVTLVITNGIALLSDKETRRFALSLGSDAHAVSELATKERAAVLMRAERDAAQATVDAGDKELAAQSERRRKAAEAITPAEKAVTDKDPAIAKARQARFEAELGSARVDRSAKASTNGVALRKAATEKLDAAIKAVEAAEQELKAPRQKLAAARDELEFAALGIQRAESAQMSARWRRQRLAAAVIAIEQEVQRAISAVNHGAAPAVVGAFSPDSQLVATIHEDGMIRLWSAEDGGAVETIPVGAGIRAVHFSEPSTLRFQAADGSWRTVGCQPTWTLERTLGSVPENSPFADRVTALAFRADGLRLASGGGEPTRGGDVQVWNPTTGVLLYAMTNLHSDAVLTLAWSPEGARLLSGGADRFARIVDTASARPIRALEGHNGHVLGVAWAPDGSTLATAGADLVLKLWDAHSGEKRKDVTGFGREVTAVSFLDNNQRLVAASGEGELRLLNEKGERQNGFKGSTDFTYAVAASADGAWIIAGGQDGSLRLWHNGEPEPRWQLAGEAARSIPEVSDRR
jgi:WD40 repeat protein